MTSSENPYRIEATDSYSIITLLPELNDSQWADFEKVGTELTERVGSNKSPKFVVDLCPLNYMGSAMVAMIVRLWKTSNEKGGQMVVVNNNEMVFEVLKLAGLQKVWTIVNTREEAVKALGKRMKPGMVGTVRSPAGASADGDSMAMPVVAGVGVIVAMIGIGLILARSTAVSPQIAFFLGMAGAIVGLIAGSMGAAKSMGGAKSASIVAVALSAILLLVGILRMPQATSADAGDVEQPETSLGTASETPPTDGGEKSNASASSKANAQDDKRGRRGDDDENEPANKEEPAKTPAGPADAATPAESPETGTTEEPAANTSEPSADPATEAEESSPEPAAPTEEAAK